MSAGAGGGGVEGGSGGGENEGQQIRWMDEGGREEGQKSTTKYDDGEK